MDGRHLVYFADPMCSWCWGFAPVIELAAARYGPRLPIRLVMGGLRPGTAEPMTAAARRELQGHWSQVTEASGQPFDDRFAGMEGFVYDTDPAARAVVAVRRLAPDAALAYLARVQRAFYAEGRDVTRLDVLVQVAEEAGLDGAAVGAEWEKEEVKMETWKDYAISQGAGVKGFPTLIAGPNPDGTYAAVTRGFSPAEAVFPGLDGWLASEAA